MTFSLNAVFSEVLVRMEEEGAFDQTAYNDLIEEILEEKREVGEIDDDANIEEYTEKLKMRWPEAEASISTGHESDILDQA